MSTKTIRLLAAPLFLLTACTLAPDYRRPDAPIPGSYPGVVTAVPTRSGVLDAAPAAPVAVPVATPVAAAQLGWREFLHDARLQHLIALALQNNRDLRVAVLNIASARAQYGIERAALFPTLSATASAGRGRGSLSTYEPGASPGNIYSAYLSASWEIDLFGRVRSLEKAALEQYLATEQSRKATQLLLVAEVANQYLTLLAADESLAVTDSTLAVADDTYRLTKLKFDTGTGSELDLREAEGALEQARAQRAAQQRTRAQAQNALQLLVGTELPADLPAGMGLEDQNIASDIPPGLPSELIERRPDIVAAEDQLIAANANIGAARAAFFPTVSLTGAAGVISPVLHDLFQSGNRAWSVSPSASVPLFNGGLNFANLDYAKAQRDIAVANYEKSIQTAFREVADGLVARATYDAQVESLNRLVAAQQRRLVLSKLRYETGVDSYLTLLTAQTDLNTARLSRVSASLDRLSNLVTLYQSLGGGWEENRGQAPTVGEANP
jgi:multidrug efflux system outer membrane protein